jgi:RNA polymerase sigma-70 factor, ECF subfamily
MFVSSISFRELFEGHVAYVWNSLRRLGVPDRDRDDLTQEVFMTVHALLEDYDPSRPVRPWLFGIAYRIVLRYRRKSWRSHLLLDDGQVASTETRHGGEAMSDAEARDLVARATAGVEITRRAVFIMADVDGNSVPEIAEALGIPLNTAYSRLRLARDDFRKAVRELEVGPLR